MRPKSIVNLKQRSEKSCKIYEAIALPYKVEKASLFANFDHHRTIFLDRRNLSKRNLNLRLTTSALA
jgi:hypothetical protein